MKVRRIMMKAPEKMENQKQVRFIIYSTELPAGFVQS